MVQRPNPAAHDARTCHAARAGYVVEIVEFLAAYLVKFRHAFMGLVHAFTYSLVIAASESVAHVKHALLLADHILGAVVILLADLTFDPVEILHRSVAQSLDAEFSGNTLTRLTALVVG